MSDSLRPRGLRHARLPCLPLSPSSIHSPSSLTASQGYLRTSRKRAQASLFWKKKFFKITEYLLRVLFCLFAVPLQHVWSSLPDQGLNPRRLHWKHWVLIASRPGRSLTYFSTWYSSYSQNDSLKSKRLFNGHFHFNLNCKIFYLFMLLNLLKLLTQ